MKKLLSILILVSMLITGLSSCEILEHIGIKKDSPENKDPVDTTTGKNEPVGEFHHLPGSVVVSRERDGEIKIEQNIAISYDQRNLPSRITVEYTEDTEENYTMDFTFDDKMTSIVSVIRIDVSDYTAKRRPHPMEER